MSGTATATLLVVTGSIAFLLGAAIAVPRVFTEPDPEARLRLLEGAPRRWRAGQPLYALGALVAASGVGVLAASAGAGRGWLAGSAVLLVVGALCWSWSVGLRSRDLRRFARGELPAWPFATYVWLTLAGLAALGVGLLADGSPAWTGWLTLLADLAFLVGYVRFRDIPPFVFYLLLPVVSVGWS